MSNLVDIAQSKYSRPINRITSQFEELFQIVHFTFIVGVVIVSIIIVIIIVVRLPTLCPFIYGSIGKNIAYLYSQENEYPKRVECCPTRNGKVAKVMREEE